MRYGVGSEHLMEFGASFSQWGCLHMPQLLAEAKSFGKSWVGSWFLVILVLVMVGLYPHGWVSTRADYVCILSIQGLLVSNCEIYFISCYELS